MLEPIAVGIEMLENISKPIKDAGHEIIFCTAPLSSEEKADRIKDADIAVIANSPLSSELVAKGQNLKMISVAFTGVDHLPLDICQERDILVCNAQGYATTAVRDLVFGLVFACLRNLKPCDEVVRVGGTKDGLVGEEIEGKTLGIIGYGAIGKCVAKTAKAFDCNILAYNQGDPLGTSDGIAEFVSFEDILKKSDIISLHVPLTDETRNMIDEKELDLMKSSAILINTARGDVVNTKALADALNAGKIAAAGIDVFSIEPPLNLDEPLINAKNAILAPHIGFATKESMVKRAKIVFENVSAWLDGKPQNVK